MKAVLVHAVKKPMKNHMKKLYEKIVLSYVFSYPQVLGRCRIFILKMTRCNGYFSQGNPRAADAPAATVTTSTFQVCLPSCCLPW